MLWLSHNSHCLCFCDIFNDKNLTVEKNIKINKIVLNKLTHSFVIKHRIIQ